MEVDLIIRGRDKDHFGDWWTMGDDIVLEVPLDKQLSEIIKMVQDVLRQRFTPEGADEPDYGEHGNPMHVTRLDIVLPVYLAKGKRDDRNITESEWSMSLRRVGLTANNCLLEFRPKEMGLWMWHPLEYYKAQYRELLVKTCVEINQCVGCTRQFFTKSPRGDGAAVLAGSSGEEPASPRHRAGVASMAWRTLRRFSTNAP